MKRLLLSLFLSFSLLSVSYATPQAIAVIDAGSTGSRINLFRYQIDTATGLPQVQQIYTQKVIPGLSSYAMNTAKASESLEPLLKGARQALQAHGLKASQTQLYVLATAGMRLLPQGTQDAIYNSIRSDLSSHEYIVGAVKTIPGWMEGIFGWISVNSLNHTLADHSQGVLDLGGASAQITFAINQTSSNTHQFKLGRYRYTLFSKSFLNLGVNEAMDRFEQFGTISACMPNGYQFNINHVRGTGHFNYEQCKRGTDAQVQSFKVSAIVPAIDHNKSFAALSALYFTFDFFKAGHSLQSLQQKVQTVCQSDWQTIKANNPDTYEPYLAQRCFEGNLTLSLLGKKGYGLQDDRDNILPEITINGTEASWAAGAAIYFLSGTGL